MKKFTFLFTIILIVLSANAQIEKGQKLFSGSGSLSLSKNKTDGQSTQNNFNILLSPSIGKAYKKNIVLGYSAQLGYGNSKGKNQLNNAVTKEKQWIAGGGVFLKKFFPLGKGFSFTGKLGANYSHLDHKFTSPNSTPSTSTTTKTNSFGLGLSSGLSYAFNKKWMCDISLNDFAGFYTGWENLETISGTTATKQKYSHIGFDSQINYQHLFSNISFGFTYLF